MAKPSNMFSSFIDGLHQAGRNASSSSSSLSSAEFSAALDFALQPRRTQGEEAGAADRILQALTAAGASDGLDLATLRDRTKLPLDPLLSGLDQAIKYRLVDEVSTETGPTRYAATKLARSGTT